MQINIFQEMVKAWGSPVVPRQKVGQFSGGLLNPRTMANLDCLGVGPKSKRRVSNRIVYRTKDLAEWLEERSSEN